MQVFLDPLSDLLVRPDPLDPSARPDLQDPEYLHREVLANLPNLSRQPDQLDRRDREYPEDQ